MFLIEGVGRGETSSETEADGSSQNEYGWFTAWRKSSDSPKWNEIKSQCKHMSS